MSILNLIKAKASKNEIKKQNWEKRGIDLTDLLRGVIDDFYGSRSKEVCRSLILGIDRAYVSFRKRFLSKMKGGR